MNDLARSELGDRFLGQLAFAPYPVQEDALLAWFTSEQGILLSAPTGTGKTLIAEAAIYEALHLGKQIYYTTPLIALTEQKFQEFQQLAEGWGFAKEKIGLVTGNRRENPDAPVLVVVAEILLNRLLNPEAFDFGSVHAVVMDEFHQFADPERGIVWELALSLLPKHVRLMLLSATVGNAIDFVVWLERQHGRKLELVQGTERKVKLEFSYIGDRLLSEHLEWMAEGDEQLRKTPALVFCFNRDECWSVADLIKGLDLVDSATQKRIAEIVDKVDLSKGAGPRLKLLLKRGVGIHHAGIMPKYRRLIERLYQQKMLSVAVCTETLAAGINLPARSVVMTTLLKGPRGKKTVIDASTAHQIFGRAGRPQFDSQGFVYVLAHEDDVKIKRWKEKYDAIPLKTSDPALIKERKALERKQPTRRSTEQYWNETQFQKLVEAPPGSLFSKGPLPWRLLAYMLERSPEIARIRTIVRKRLQDAPRLAAGERQLRNMLIALEQGGFVKLDPPNPDPPVIEGAGLPNPADTSAALATPNLSTGTADAKQQSANESATASSNTGSSLTFGRASGSSAGLTLGSSNSSRDAKKTHDKQSAAGGAGANKPKQKDYAIGPDEWFPITATPTEKLPAILKFRTCHPLYGTYLLSLLGEADEREKMLTFESILEFPVSAVKPVRAKARDLGTGALATSKLDPELIARGLMSAKSADPDEEEDDFQNLPPEEREWPMSFAEKVHALFQVKYPLLTDVRVVAIHCAGELIFDFNGNFDKYIKSKDMIRQEGLVFRHLLRLILLLAEFDQFEPETGDPIDWHAQLHDMRQKLIKCCHEVDPSSTDLALDPKLRTDLVAGETAAASEPAQLAKPVLPTTPEAGEQGATGTGVAVDGQVPSEAVAGDESYDANFGEGLLD